MWESILDMGETLAGGSTAVLIAGLGARMEFIRMKTEKLILNGSEDIKHERAVKTFESAFKTATRCLGYEIRRIQNDKTLNGRPEDISYRFNAVWLNEWKEMLRSLSGATYKGRPLELYAHSALNDWNRQKDTLLDFLIKEMNGVNTPVENLEKFLSGFKHSLEYGSENWLNNGLLHQEEVIVKKPLFKKQTADIPEVEIYEPEQTKA